MSGFEATRAIRAYEKDNADRFLRRRSAAERLASPSSESLKPAGSSSLLRPATIIALTGLAAGRDVTEAFASGVDLFLTKPIPFKEVSKIVDEWIANRQAE